MNSRKVEIENPTLNFEPQIMHAREEAVRRAGSSGGVVSALIRDLLHKGEIGTALGFRFELGRRYYPVLVHAPDDYKPVGSIYHDMDLAAFIRGNLGAIRAPFLVTARPCEIKAIRHMLEQAGIESLLIGLTCSAQMSFAATEFLFRKCGIEGKEVISLKYRGDGWPSGVRIETAGEKYYFHNNRSFWTEIFHSQIFTLRRCFSCRDTFGLEADFSVADPWLEKYIRKETIGNTLVMVHSPKGKRIIDHALIDGTLTLQETISRETALQSQAATLRKKCAYRRFPRVTGFINALIRNAAYRFVWGKIGPLRVIHGRLLRETNNFLAKL